jgi:hypothetical protein
MRLRELSRHRLGVLVSLAIALFAAFWSVQRITLFPLGIESRSLETASATTRVMVDSPRSMVLDLSVQVADIEALSNRALLVGNLLGSLPVKQAISRRVGVPVDRLEISAPITREWPRAITQAGTERSTSDIVRSPDQYRINVRSNPTVPIIEISAQAPTAAAAEKLADGAVLGAEDYLRGLAARQGLEAGDQIRLEQLGRAEGGVINDGVGYKVALLSFLLAFGACCAGVMLLARVRGGWDAAAAARA